MAKLRVDLPIYTFDIDFNGHVSNIVYVRWMEVARIRLLEAIDMPVSELLNQGFGPVLVETQIKYKLPLNLGDEVHVMICVTEMVKASVWMDFEFRNSDNHLVASARQRGLFVDHATGRPRRFTSEDIERIERYFEPLP